MPPLQLLPPQNSTSLSLSLLLMSSLLPTLCLTSFFHTPPQTETHTQLLHLYCAASCGPLGGVAFNLDITSYICLLLTQLPLTHKHTRRLRLWILHWFCEYQLKRERYGSCRVWACFMAPSEEWDKKSLEKKKYGKMRRKKHKRRHDRILGCMWGENVAKSVNHGGF